MPADPAKASYHHGDLREALVTAAERLMAEQSSWTFTLREVARAAGVSHNAPYNHFPDRRALLAAVAARGFDAMTAAQRRTLETVDSEDVPACLRATARAYVAFAVAHPSRYRLMFSAELADCEDSLFKAAAEQAFGVLQNIIERGVADRIFQSSTRSTHALTAWSLVHGLGTLLIDGKVPGSTDSETVTALTDAATATLLNGLANPMQRKRSSRKS